MKHITVTELQNIIDLESQNPSVDFVNVCTPAEYKEKHILGVRNVPLSEIESHKDEFLGKKTVYLHCRSGNRSKQAIEKLSQLGVTAELVNVEGGLLAWDEAGYETQSHTSRMPVMRQVLLSAGVLILVGSILTYTLDIHFILLTGFVGAGLAFAGFTGWCGMAYVLSKVPWNT